MIRDMPPENPPVENSPKSLPLVIAVLVLLLAAGGIWYVLSRPTGNEALSPSGLPSDGSASGSEGVLKDSGQYYEITGRYPASTSLKATAGAKQDALAIGYMKTFVEQEAARFKDTNVSGLTAEDIQVQELGGDRRYTLDIEYKAYQSPVAVSYVYLMYANTMGAHPNTYYRTFVFDASSGEGLHLDDIFSPTADYLGVLSMLSREKLAVQMEKAGGVAPDKDMLEAGTTPDADNFQNFYLEGPDLVLIFPPYQVAPYVYGAQEVRIPRTELGNALKAEYR